jgi:hypothetical protein
MREEHFHKASLPVRVPRGNEGFWQIICRLSETQSSFTVEDIDGESNVNPQLIRKYIRLLVAGGFVESCGSRGAKSGKSGDFKAGAYRLLKKQRQAPRVRADGSLIPRTTAMEQLWTAIRSLKTFGLRDLIFSATTEDVKPSYALAKRYAHYLTTGGYLTVINPTHTGKQRWRLKPGMNTGPLPPRMKAIRADAMWDPNLGAFVGEPAIAKEVS